MTQTPTSLEYADIPWFRRNWFAIAAGLLFAPALLPVLLTGNIYYVRRGELKQYSVGAKLILGIWSALITAGLANDIYTLTRAQSDHESGTVALQTAENDGAVTSDQESGVATPSSAKPTSDSKLPDSTQLLEAQLASLSEQLKVFGNKCISTHDADACDEVQALKFQRDSILESPEYQMALLKGMVDASEKQAAIDASPEGQAKLKEEASHKYREAYSICEGLIPEPKGDDGIVTYSRTIACSNRDDLKRRYPDFKEHVQSIAGAPQPTTTVSDAVNEGGATQGDIQTPAPQAPIGPSAPRPSFDCTRASTQVELMICRDAELSKSDSDLADLYRKSIVAAATGAGVVRQAQRAFLSKRNQCATEACISQAYRSRQEELEEQHQ